MLSKHDKLTIISMAVISSAAATLLHEGLGHGVTAWLRGDTPTELTSNHLSDLRADHWVEAAGTLVNFAVGAIALLLSQRSGHRSNRRYFLWIFAALNLLPGAGYFMYSGIMSVGEWQAVIANLPHQLAAHIALSIFGVLLYVFVVRRLAIAAKPFCPKRSNYNTVGRLPYYAACLFSCVAGALDPLGLRLFFVATVAAAFGGSSGLMWADSLMPAQPAEPELWVQRQPAWWVAAVLLGLPYIVFIGRGIHFAH
jgi:hypothetical protein